MLQCAILVQICHLCWCCFTLGCVYKGRMYANGLVFPDNKDPCVICQCKNGYIECSKKACPELNCPKDSLKPAGNRECCPTCVGKVVTIKY